MANFEAHRIHQKLNYPGLHFVTWLFRSGLKTSYVLLSSAKRCFFQRLSYLTNHAGNCWPPCSYNEFYIWNEAAMLARYWVNDNIKIVGGCLWIWQFEDWHFTIKLLVSLMRNIWEPTPSDIQVSICIFFKIHSKQKHFLSYLRPLNEFWEKSIFGHFQNFRIWHEFSFWPIKRNNEDFCTIFCSEIPLRDFKPLHKKWPIFMAQYLDIFEYLVSTRKIRHFWKFENFNMCQKNGNIKIFDGKKLMVEFAIILWTYVHITIFGQNRFIRTCEHMSRVKFTWTAR